MRIISIILAVAALAPLTSSAADVSERVEIAADFVLAPTQGYDDNDNVEVVIHGSLPSGCYSLADTEISKTSPNNYQIKQFATLRLDGVCAQGETLPAHMTMTVPFVTVVSIGQLQAGTYSLNFKTGQNLVGQRTINVDKATRLTVDTLPYAAVTAADVTDVIPSTEDVEVSLSGVLNSTCSTLDQDVKVEKQGDVFVVLPTIKVKPGVQCLQVRMPFRKVINLGKQQSGHYLVHVRSMSGRSVNRVIEITQ